MEEMVWPAGAGRRASWEPGVDSPGEVQPTPASHNEPVISIHPEGSDYCNCGDGQPPGDCHTSVQCKSETRGCRSFNNNYPTTLHGRSAPAAIAKATCSTWALPLCGGVGSRTLACAQSPAAPLAKSNL